MPTTPLLPPVVHLDHPTDTKHHIHGDLFEAHLSPVASLLGASKLGARLVVVPPGKRAWPRHNHHANEEMFVLLAGSARWTLGAQTCTVYAGDVVLAPPGGPDTAHQLVNISPHEDLRYLAISTMHAPDVLEYPDSQKIGVIAGSAPGGDSAARTLTAFFSEGTQRAYWEGE